MMMVKVIKNVKHFIFITLLIYVVFRNSPIKKQLIKIDRFIPDLKYILLWSPIHGLNGDGQKYFIDHKCEKYNCYFTNNKTLFNNTRYFDVILFNLQDVSEDIHDLPKTRGLMQKYVFVANDSADNFPICSENYENFFNWTWSYRYDSTISYQFFYIHNTDYEKLDGHFQWYQHKHMKPVDSTFKSQFATKSRAAVIFLDKCKTRSKREGLVSNLQLELSKLNLSLDIFGNCGSKQCKRKNMNPCFWRLKKTYYFYLAFEDSIAYDYVTDIVLYAYNFNAVPIVYGGARYDKYLPPRSYINALNATTKSLALTMQSIIKNKERYFDFFRWRNHYAFSKGSVLDGCELCKALNNPARLTQKGSYRRFRRWWNSLYESRCYNFKMNKYVIL